MKIKTRTYLCHPTALYDPIARADSIQTLPAIIKTGLLALAAGIVLMSFAQDSFAQESSPESANQNSSLEGFAPPSLGDDTKGEPALAETEPLPSTQENTTEQTAEEEENFGPLGQATITEDRREGGQVYRLELEHSIGGRTQVLEENDSDGKLESRSTGLDEEVNIPKWKIGSW